MSEIPREVCEGNLYNLDVQLYELAQERIYLEQIDSEEARMRMSQIDEYYNALLVDRQYWEHMLYSGEGSSLSYNGYAWSSEYSNVPESQIQEPEGVDQKSSDIKTPVALYSPIAPIAPISPIVAFADPVLPESAALDLSTPISMVDNESELKGDVGLPLAIPEKDHVGTPVELSDTAPSSTQFLLQSTPKDLDYDASLSLLNSKGKRDSQISTLSESPSHNQLNPLDMHQTYGNSYYPESNVMRPKEGIHLLKNPETPKKQQRISRKNCILAVIILIIVVVVAIVLSLLLSKRGADQNTISTPPSPSPVASTSKPQPTPFAKSYSSSTLSSNIQGPAGVRIDPLSGDIFVSEYKGNTISRISRSGSKSVFVGSGSSGLKDGLGLSAQFTPTTAFAVDSKGTIYAPDYTNNAIRVIDKNGQVSTILRNSISKPSGICVDRQDNLFLADTGNSRIVKIDTSNGNKLTQVGNSLKPAANGLAVDFYGNFFFTTPDDNIIYKMDANSSFAITPFVGSNPGSSDGTGQQASFNKPSNLIFDTSNYLYVADASNNMIRKVNVETKQVLTISKDSLRNPHDMAVNSNGLVYVADEGNDSVKILTPQ